MSAADVVVLVTIFGSTILFGGAVALALGWAFRDGQFENFERGSRSIFGPDEPVGEATDFFPGQGVKPIHSPQGHNDRIMTHDVS